VREADDNIHVAMSFLICFSVPRLSCSSKISSSFCQLKDIRVKFSYFCISAVAYLCPHCLGITYFEEGSVSSFFIALFIAEKKTRRYRERLACILRCRRPCETDLVYDTFFCSLLFLAIYCSKIMYGIASRSRAISHVCMSHLKFVSDILFNASFIVAFSVTLRYCTLSDAESNM
jgi:hypothetical protein